jgi:hypothetical protein
MLRDKVNFTIELLYNQSTDHKSKAYTLSINLLLLIFNGAKQSEQLALILDVYSKARVKN